MQLPSRPASGRGDDMLRVRYVSAGSRPASGRGRHWLAASLLVLTALLVGCDAPQRAAVAPAAAGDRAVARQGDYTATLTLLPLAELGLPPTPGAPGEVGYRLEIAGPVSARVDMETFLLTEPSRASHAVFAHGTFSREPGGPSGAPLGQLEGAIGLPAGARVGHELRLLAAVEIPGGWMESSPSLWLRLEAGAGGMLHGVPAMPTLGLPPGVEPPTLPLPMPRRIPAPTATARSR